jgi:hypothetical protein
MMCKRFMQNVLMGKKNNTYVKKSYLIVAILLFLV